MTTRGSLLIVGALLAGGAMTLLLARSARRASAAPDVSALQEEVGALRAEVSALRSGRMEAMTVLGRGLDGAGKAPTSPSSAAPEAQPPSAPAPKLTADHLATAMSEGLTAEARDGAWAPGAESQLYAAFQVEAFKETSIKRIECRSTMCRIELDHRNREALDQFNAAVRDIPMFQNTEFFAHGQDREWKRYELYLARAGHTLPHPEL